MKHAAPSDVAHNFVKRMVPVGEVTPLELDEAAPALLCHIYLLNSVLERLANRFAEQHDLTMPQWMALGSIGHGGDEGITHSELGGSLMLSKAPITGVVDRLERDGYVRRVPDANDRRVSRIMITAKGQKTWQEVRQTLREHAVRQCSCLSDEEQHTMIALLARLLSAVAQSDPTLPVPQTNS